MFEFYFRKINIENNKLINRIDAMTSTQVERKFGWQQEKYSLAKEKELGELNKNVTRSCCLFQHRILIHFAVISNLHFQSHFPDALRKISYILGFIFNNYSPFVNPSLHLIFCGDGVYICKIKKNMVSCHAIADKS